MAGGSAGLAQNLGIGCDAAGDCRSAWADGGDEDNGGFSPRDAGASIEPRLTYAHVSIDAGIPPSAEILQKVPLAAPPPELVPPQPGRSLLPRVDCACT